MVVRNVYGEEVTFDQYRVEEKIEEIKNSIPPHLYKVFKKEWAVFLQNSADKCKGDRTLEEYDHFFDQFINTKITKIKDSH